MAGSIMQVAKQLGQLSGWSLSNLAIQKIGYIAEMLHLGRHGTPLIDENWQAWSYGPVQPGLYHRAKVFGADAVKDIFVEPPFMPGTDQEKAVIDAYSMMKDLTPGRMINVTHQNNGAWAKSYAPGAKGRTIPKSAIQAEYSTLIQNDN